MLAYIATLIVGIGLGYGFRALIGQELVAVKDRLAALESKVKAKL